MRTAEAAEDRAPKPIFERLLGGDAPTDVLRVLALFGLFIVVDRGTASFASLPPFRLFSPVLVQQAVGENTFVLALMLSGAVAAVALGRRRILSGWNTLEHGTVLRVVGSAVALWLAWRTCAYDFNYVLDRWHFVDRGLVVVLAVAIVARPVFLLPLVAQVRVVGAQFSYPLGTDFGQNIDEMMVLVLVALGVTHLLYAVTGRRETSGLLLVWSTIVAAHFFEPGRAKLPLTWMQVNDVSYLPFNSYTAGWGGQGDGAYARGLGNFIGGVGWPVKVGTLVLELGALLAVAHPALLRVWLPMGAAFHALTFALTGFFFFDWIAFELALWLILVLPALRAWVGANKTPARAIVAMAAVLAGGTLYHPPRLAWLDAPVGYGYEIEAIGSSGREYHVPLSMFAPFEQELTFVRAQLAPLRLAAGGYGAISSPVRLRELESLTDIAELALFEGSLGAATVYPDSLSERLVTSFFRHVSLDPGRRSIVPNAPMRFWAARGEPAYRGQEPLASMRVVLVASLTTDGRQQFRRTPLLQLARGPGGEPTVERLPTQSAR